jgi:hypothetical protein
MRVRSYWVNESSRLFPGGDRALILIPYQQRVPVPKIMSMIRIKSMKTGEIAI